MSQLKPELSKQYQPAEVETKWLDFWQEQQYFKADPAAEGEAYCIAIPPPNVTGVLHMGHGLDETIQDTLIRYHRLQGKNVLWVPGTDHAGIATQHVVVEKLHREGKNRHEMGREAFLEEVWKWKEEAGGTIGRQLRRLGCSCDWSREAFTLDEKRARAVRVAFKRLYDKGLIYRGEYLVNWDPVSLTALSDDEVDYEDEQGFLYHLKYPLADGSGTITVATTRPETMLGDTAVAVNPTDERWQHLVGKMINLPLTGRQIPVITDDFVKKDFGTGMVKITPAHDPNDFLMGQRHGLPMINVMTDDAKMNNLAGKFAGMDRYEARKAIVEEFKALGLLEKVEPHPMRIGRGYRSKAVIEPRLSKQWFVKIAPLAAQAKAAVESGEIRILPQTPWEGIYFNWMNNVRDWCISRQLWWGHRIPIWYKKSDPSVMICFDGEGLPAEVAGAPNEWVQDEDVLDTWFSSALWPASILGWPDETEDLKRWYPTSVLVTGHDILFFWVARMVMFGLELVGRKPFTDVYMHGLIFGKTYYEKIGQDYKLIPPMQAREFDISGEMPKNVEAKWEKMSKSKGNVIDPLEVIGEYGTDALRLTVGGYAALGRNIDLDWRRFQNYRNFVNKFWNAARFVLMVTEPLKSEDFRRGIDSCSLEVEDRWILSSLNKVIIKSTETLDRYEFDQYVAGLYDFIWLNYCDWYLEMVKGRAYGHDEAEESHRAARTTLLVVLEHVCRLLHPIMPFVTEEIWHIIRARVVNVEAGVSASGATSTLFGDCFAAPSLCVGAWPKPSLGLELADSEETIALLQEAVGAIRNIRGEMRVPMEMKVGVTIEHKDSAGRDQLSRVRGHLRSLARVDQLKIEETAVAPKFASTFVSGAMTILVSLPSELVEAEVARLEKELAFAEKGLLQCSSKLENAKFVENAPTAVVEKERQNQAKLQADVDAMRQKLAELKG